MKINMKVIRWVFGYSYGVATTAGFCAIASDHQESHPLRSAFWFLCLIVPIQFGAIYIVERNNKHYE